MQVGQKDTRWLIPLKVSRGYQGEEGNHTYQALQVFYGCGPIYFSGFVFPGRSFSSFFAQDTPPINASFWVERNAPPFPLVKQLWHIVRMGVHLSIKAKLFLAASARKELKSAMEEFNRACNTLSELAF